MSFEPHIRRLYDDNGGLTAPMVVESARPKDAPLHGYFEWDDKAAAEEFRLEQARSMIRRVRFVVEDSAGVPAGRAVREFQWTLDARAGEAPRRVYRRVTDMTEAEREEVRERMKRSISSLIGAYRDQDEFWVLLRAEIAAA